MPYLILDLDETTCSYRLYNIHSAHLLSTPFDADSCKSNIEKTYRNLRVINPDKLSNVICDAYRHYDGVMILTSGYWKEKIKVDIADKLFLPEDIKQKFIQCPFYSPSTEKNLGIHDASLTASDISKLLKVHRINKIRASNLCYQDKVFVLMEDKVKHVYSCEGESHISAVLATTASGSTSFYDTALEKLRSAKLKEIEHANAVAEEAYFDERLDTYIKTGKRRFGF